MWPKRKPRNRRLGREQVLEVKLRSSQVRAARTRLAAIGLGSTFAAVFGLYLLYRVGEWALDQLVYENKAFAIQTIDVQTDGVVSANQLRRWTGVRLGENLFALDLARVKRDLEMISLVRSVSVERDPPHTLRVRIAERQPIAQVNVPPPRGKGGVAAALYHLDADGQVMLPLDPRQRAAQPDQAGDALPSLLGSNPAELRPGRRVDDPQVQAALRLIAAFEQSPMAELVDLRRIDVSSQQVVVATTSQGSELTFGLTDLDQQQQLRRWQAIFDLAQKTGNTIARLDLAISNNIPLRWFEASAAPPAVPKVSKPIRPRKKHV